MNYLLGTSSINLTAGWNTVWGDIQTALGSQLTTLVTAIGALLVVGAILKWLWDRKRSGSMGGAGAHSGLLWTFIIGAVLTAPAVIVPIFLNLSDFVTNAIVNLFGG
jgi:hypothetical protein